MVLFNVLLNSSRWRAASSRPYGCGGNRGVYHSTYDTPSVSPFGLTAFNRGMIATGNHNFERFAALCNTPEVEPSGTSCQRVAKLATPTERVRLFGRFLKFGVAGAEKTGEGQATMNKRKGMNPMRVLLLCCCLLGLVLPVEAAESSPKYVALTFDDGPSGRFTGRLLDGLKERDAHATFLLCGYRVKQYPNETKRIVAEGHEIGNHGYSHRNMQQLSRREIAQELIDTQALLPDVNICFIRPPGGCCSDGVRQVAEARNLAILNWSVDPRDWALADAASVERAVLKNVSDGDVILLHDMSDSSVTAALHIIDQLSAQGYRFVTASQLAALRGCVPKAGKTYHSFPPQ